MRGRVGRSVAWLALVFALTMCLVERGSAQAPGRASTDDPFYAYTDDSGQLIYVQRLEDVPLRLRAYARRVDGPATSGWSQLGARAESDIAALLRSAGVAAGAGAAQAPPVALYRYKGGGGRVVYTNLGDAVPPAQRAAARLDLSHISLNSALGVELDAVVRAEHERLASQPRCQQLRTAADRTLIQQVWQEHAPLVVFGGVLSIMVFASPWMMRWVGGREWARTLSMALPVLAAAGVFTYATVQSSRALSALKTQAIPCEAKNRDQFAKHDGGLIERLHLLQSLRIQTQALDQIAQESR